VRIHADAAVLVVFLDRAWAAQQDAIETDA